MCPRRKDREQTQEDTNDAKENEELMTSCEISEPSLHYAPIIPVENENIGNAYGATLTEESVLRIIDAENGFSSRRGG
ncbi:unnamed protein product [Urochloa humidicola]